MRREQGAARRPRRCLGAFALALLLLPAAGPAVAADAARPRPRVDDTGYPWQAFGRLNNQGSGFCTGVLVGPKVVLTAAHCLYDRRSGLWAGARRLHFVAGYRGQSYAFHARAVAYRVAEGYDPSKTLRNAREAVRDWAVVTLERAAPARLGYLGLARIRAGAPLPAAADMTLAGYGRDRPYALSADRGCRLLGWDSEHLLLVHDCRAVHGTSGAPIIRRQDGQYLIYGIHVGRDEPEETIGAAVPAGRFFEAVRRATGRAPQRGPDRLEFLPARAGE